VLDRSGSMKGVGLEIAKSTVKKILSTLTDDDRFNVIAVRLRLYITALIFRLNSVRRGLPWLRRNETK